MQTNGHVNGTPAQAPLPQTIQVNPQQCAAVALTFLARAPTTRAERDSYDMAEMFLQAIVSGQVTLAPGAPQAAAAAPGEADKGAPG